MPMTFNLSFAGSVLCYKKNDLWTFVFPTDATHTVTYSVNGGSAKPLRRPGINSEIKVTVDKPAVRPPKANDRFPDILNMSAANMHGTTNGKSNLMVTAKSSGGRELLVLTCDSGIAGPSTLTGYNYWIEQTNPPIPHVPLGKPIAAEVSLKVVVNSGKGLSLAFLDTPSIPIGAFKYVSGTNVDLRFDNDCRTCKAVDDFEHYYDWVEDTAVSYGGRPRRFRAGKEPHPFSKAGKLLSPSGNCDPAGSEPPPEP